MSVYPSSVARVAQEVSALSIVYASDVQEGVA